VNENYEIFRELYGECREHTLSEVIERWSGIGISIPAFTGAVRDERIVEDYLQFEDTIPKERRYLILAKRYRVSNRKVIQAIKSTTSATTTTTPSLFDETE